MSGPKTDRVSAEIAGLETLPYPGLRQKWKRCFRVSPPKTLSRNLLILGISWKIQERAFGGLSASTKRRLEELAQNMDSKSDLAKQRRIHLRPGARLLREWNGETHDVLVTEEGFVWNGKTWRSLSVIAREITGARWSGPRFFGLHRKARSDGAHISTAANRQDG